MANTFKNEIYRPVRIFSYILYGAFGLLGLCSVFYILMSLVMAFTSNSQIDLGDGESVDAWLGLIGIVALLEIPLRVVTTVLFLVWLYRAFNNLSPLKARNLEYSPGWAVGWWFIPLANLVKPFQVMRELYNESDPDFDDETGFLKTSPGTPEIIGFWWAAYIISNIVFRVSDMMIDDKTGQVSGGFPVTFLVGGILSLAASVLVIFIVKEITRRQELRFSRIAGRGNFAPPPPPSFEQYQPPRPPHFGHNQ